MKRALALIVGCLTLATASTSFADPPKPPVLCSPSHPCTSAPTAADRAVKWHPGHYVTLDPILYRDNLAAGKAEHFSTIAEICNVPEWKGVQLFAAWATVEGDTAGDWAPGIALVREYLDRLRPCNKRLIFDVWRTIFGGGARYAYPAYLRTGSRYGITSPLNYGSGATARVWQAATADRLIEMSRVFAEAFDDEPLLVVYTPWNETSLSLESGIDGYSASALNTQMQRVTVAARTHWEHTLLRLPANFTAHNDAQLQHIFGVLSPLGYGIGGPDTIPNNDIWANRVFTGASGGVDYRGVLPFFSEVQVPELGGKEGTFTPKQLYDHAMHGCASNCPGSDSADGSIRPVWPQYFIWYRNHFQGGSAQRWATGIRPFVENEARGRVNDGRGRIVAPADVPCPRGIVCQ